MPDLVVALLIVLAGFLGALGGSMLGAIIVLNDLRAVGVLPSQKQEGK
jgi:hypothetical protein